MFGSNISCGHLTVTMEGFRGHLHVQSLQEYSIQYLKSEQDLSLLHTFQFTYQFVFGSTVPQWARASSFTRFLDHTQRRTAVGRSPLGEWSACRRDLHLKTHNTHNRLTFMRPMGFEPTTPEGERPQTYALDRAATGTDYPLINGVI